MKLLILIFICSSIDAYRYDGYQVYKVIPRDESSFKALTQLHQLNTFDFWTLPHRNQWTDIMTSAQNSEQLQQYFNENNIHYEMKIEDVQQLIEKSKKSIDIKMRNSSPYNITWSTYYPYDNIRDFCYQLAAIYPQWVTVSSAGQSYEGREMILVKISSGSSPKNAIFIDAGIHAREWITPAVATYLMQKLVDNYSQHPQLIDSIDWYFMPIINPDGYQYSHTTERLWRKTRSPNNNSSCVGTDMNRNFDFHWNEGGSSSDPCSEVFHGNVPFSEPESKAVRDAILSVANQTKLYLTLHSYSQVLIKPWSWTTELPEDDEEINALAIQVVDALNKTHGQEYSVSAPSDSYVTGCTDDWSKGVAGIKYSYTLESRDRGAFGFLLPEDQIQATCEETFEAIKVLANAVMKM